MQRTPLVNPWESAYGAAKAALDQWTHGLAVDLHGTGVHAGLVSPGPIDTEIWKFGAVPVMDGVPGLSRLVRRGLVRFGARANPS